MCVITSYSIHYTKLYDVRPAAAWVVFDGSVRVPLAWEGDRFVGSDRDAARLVEVVASLPDGAQLAVGFEPGGRSR